MNNYLPTDYQSFIHTSRYAKYFDGKGRESWPETVGRYVENVVRPVVDTETANEIEQAILSLEVMPSMRAMMTAGIALDRDNTAGYNCSYLPVDDPKSFDEAMFILLCGTGVGFSVERQFISKLPEIPKLFQSDTTIVVKDSKEGWAKAFRQLLVLLWAGEIPLWDVSRVRPAGARLKTFGGRASGPAPLVDLFNFAVKLFKEAEGRKLSSIECHDLMCKIGEIVVVGGVRRSAMISLSNLSDDRMRHAKSGNWWDNEPQRALANNSVSYTEKPDSLSFMREWMALVESGVVNVVSSIGKQLRNKLQKITDVLLTMTLELIHVLRLFLDRINSATLQKLLLGLQITWMILLEKLDLLLFWVRYNQHTPNFHTCGRCGQRIQKRSVRWVCHSQG